MILSNNTETVPAVQMTATPDVQTATPVAQATVPDVQTAASVAQATVPDVQTAASVAQATVPDVRTVTPVINIVGAGLAGCEAAWQAINAGVRVRLYEMKPQKFSPAHHSAGFAELVCSNSFRSNVLANAIGVLKEEMRRLHSLIMEAAYATEVPAGSALAVDRQKFSDYITGKLRSHPLVEVIEGEVTEIPEGITVIASGPLTSDTLSKAIEKKIGGEYLHFFDAAAPIVSFDSIDMTKAFYASRYGKGEASYINCPFTKEEYEVFYQALITAEEAELKDFDRNEQLTVFEGCMPVEVMAKRGHDTLLFGPMKPVGITVPSTGREAYAIVQLRQENNAKTMYNLVGFQTHLKFPEQKRVFGLIPGLENAEFLRYGVMHRNTFINSPGLLDETYMLKSCPGLFFAGQMTGVEGYIESASSGLVAGRNAANMALGKEPVCFGADTVIGSLGCYVSGGNGLNFQPMNANFGIVMPLDHRVKGGKRAKNEALAARAVAKIERMEGILPTEVESLPETAAAETGNPTGTAETGNPTGTAETGNPTGTTEAAEVKNPTETVRTANVSEGEQE